MGQSKLMEARRTRGTRELGQDQGVQVQVQVEPGQGLMGARAGCVGSPCCAPLIVGGQKNVDITLSPQDFLRCVTAALIYFVISITAVAKYSDGAYKAAGVSGCPTPLRRYPTVSLS